MSSPAEILKRYWGYNSFRPLQQEIITSVLAGKDTLALLPTGGGKSLCYQVPAVMNDGFCLVISPLIALMHDQVARLKEQGINAASIDAGMRYTDVRRTFDNMLHGPYKLLYVSPERLQTELFKEYLPEFNISLIAVDEAHCISQWGYDFRPDYLKIAGLRNVFEDVSVLALTASATDEVREDIISNLELRSPGIYKNSFARQNIRYEVKYSENKNADTVQQVTPAESSIIYCRSRRQTEALAKYLGQSGIAAMAYHAGMAKDKRKASQQAWMQHKIPVMVATTAFGLGIDKGDVRTVLHYDAPEHLEAYYQETGRAGRDGKPAYALALYNSIDIKRLQESTALQYPNEAYLREVYQAVVEYLQIPVSAQPDHYYPFDLSEFCKRFGLQALPASYALKLLEQEGFWTMSESVFHPTTIQFTADRHVLDQLAHTYPDLYYVTTGLLRLYGTVFQYPTAVRISAIAKQLKLKKELAEQLLKQLHKMEILEYNAPGEGPQLFFHHYRVDSRHLIIDTKRINNLRTRHEARTQAMIRFLQNETECRESMILDYFGEKTYKDCGHCDVCYNKPGKQALNPKDLRSEILQNLDGQDNITLQKLIANYAMPVREQAITLIRGMIDEGVLQLKESGIILLSR